jgi:hypothetical protein
VHRFRHAQAFNLVTIWTELGAIDVNDNPFSFGGPDRSGHDTKFIGAILGHLFSLPESLFGLSRLADRPLRGTPEHRGSGHTERIPFLIKSTLMTLDCSGMHTVALPNGTKDLGLRLPNPSIAPRSRLNGAPPLVSPSNKEHGTTPPKMVPRSNHSRSKLNLKPPLFSDSMLNLSSSMQDEDYICMYVSIVRLISYHTHYLFILFPSDNRRLSYSKCPVLLKQLSGQDT